MISTVTLKHDSYTVLEPLNSGAQGIVLKIRRASDQRILAMKTVRTQQNNQNLSQTKVDKLATRFQREIDFLNNQENPEQHFIISCLDYGSIADEVYGSLPVMVMPYYQQTLESQMPPYPANEPGPHFRQCCLWIAQMITALQATHQFTCNGEQFIHRDFKTSNILLTDNLEIRLIDFGIARAVAQNHATFTVGHSIESGAPEQILCYKCVDNTPKYAIGQHSDLYALGTVIYRLFTSAITDAQERLGHPGIYGDHLMQLEKDGKGLLGSIGGLQNDEYQLLYSAVLARLQNHQQSTGTLVSTLQTTLPDFASIAECVADFVRLLLHPDYQQRPSISQAKNWIDTLYQALDPEIEQLEIHLEKAAIATGEATKIKLIASGKGLPANGHWISITGNGKPLLTQPSLVTQTGLQCSFITADSCVWDIQLPAFHEAGEVSLQTRMLLEDKAPLLSETTLQVAPKISTKSAKLVWLVLLLICLSAVLISAFIYRQELHHYGSLVWLDYQLQQGDQRQQLQAWRSLNQLSKKDSDAQQRLDAFEQQTNRWLNSDSMQNWQKAIPRLQLSAEKGDENAMLWMAYAYTTGHGVEKNWAAAVTWYQRAIAMDSSSAAQRLLQLQQRATDILSQAKDTEAMPLAKQVKLSE